MPTFLLAVGSNLGDSRRTIDQSLSAIDQWENTQVVARSSLHRTRALGGPQGQGEFLNGAVVVQTNRTPLELLHALQEIEIALGRKREERWSARTIDLDILLAGDQKLLPGESVIETDCLTIPHPRMSYRPFVLGPAVEIAGNWSHPLLHATLDTLWQQLREGDESLLLYGGSAEDRKWHVDQLTAHFPTLRILGPATVARESPSPQLAIQLRQQGEGPISGLPTLTLPASGRRSGLPELLAAIEGVWPDLGRQVSTE